LPHDTISFRIDRKRKAALDKLAKAMERDRSHLINQALADFIELHNWQIARIKAGLAAAEAGDYASDADIDKAMAKWRR
jgi:predicted transcriptional regulator